jgi:hypothetical protein
VDHSIRVEHAVLFASTLFGAFWCGSSMSQRGGCLPIKFPGRLQIEHAESNITFTRRKYGVRLIF